MKSGILAVTIAVVTTFASSGAHAFQPVVNGVVNVTCKDPRINGSGTVINYSTTSDVFIPGGIFESDLSDDVTITNVTGLINPLIPMQDSSSQYPYINTPLATALGIQISGTTDNVGFQLGSAQVSNYSNGSTASGWGFFLQQHNGTLLGAVSCPPQVGAFCYFPSIPLVCSRH